jgi:hypothetical protein
MRGTDRPYRGHLMGRMRPAAIRESRKAIAALTALLH